MTEQYYIVMIELGFFNKYFGNVEVGERLALPGEGAGWVVWKIQMSNDSSRENEK